MTDAAQLENPESLPPTSAKRLRDRLPLPGPGSASTPLPFRLVAILFVVSGAAGLVDQVCFSKYLGYIVGSTAYAVSAVLAAFMVGLSLGAHWGGRLAARLDRPLQAYGVLELVVAACVAVSAPAFHALGPLYVAAARALPDSLVALSALRWILALAVVVIPTVAMGATLPVLTRALAPQPGRRDRQLGALYAANTLGGASGALLAAYVVLPALGLSGTLLGSATLSAIVGAVAIAFGRRVTAAPHEAAASPPASGPDAPNEGTPGGARLEAEVGSTIHPRAPHRDERPLLMVLAIASGALIFILEVVETHLLAVLIGNSAYAFGLILAIFLICLFFGASRAAWAARRFGHRALPLSLFASGLSLLVTLPVWDELPLLFTSLGKEVITFEGREAVRAASAFCLLAAPTTLMGLTFPLLLQRVARERDVGLWVGRLTAVNTLGAVAGSLAAGYLLLPVLGSELTLRAVAVSFLLLGAAASRIFGPSTGASSARAAPVVLAGAATLIALLLPRWDLVKMTAGTNVYFDGHQQQGELRFVREDVHGGVTTVIERPARDREGPVSTLYTNGKFQGNNGWELKAQRFFAHYPSLFVSRFDHALVIGLGTGTTLGTLAAYPWKRLDLVEISPAIVEAAGEFFRGPNRGALDDPRLAVHIADGRNHLLLDQGKYDLIGMELSSIWFAGAASLYSVEYYELVRARLRPGGIFQQWVQLHHIYEKDFATILNTLCDVFPHVALFYGGGQGILVASDEPLRTSSSRLEALMARDAIHEVLPDGRLLPELLGDVLVTGNGLERYLDDLARSNDLPRTALRSTDDNLYLEYATPRGNVLPWKTRERLVAHLKTYRAADEIRGMLVE